MSHDASPRHDQVRLSLAEVKTIAEIERRLQEEASRTGPTGGAVRRPSRGRRLLRGVVRGLPLLTPVGLILVLLPAPLPVRVAGLALAVLGIAGTLARAVTHYRNRRRRAP